MKERYVIERLEENFYRDIMPGYASVQIKQSELGDMAGILGAATALLA
jgi:hypothetical protein